MPKKKTQKKATNHPTRETTTELISWGTRVLPRGIVGAQSFATNQHNVYFLMKDGTVKSLIPEINTKHYKAIPNNLAGITQITAVGDYGFALSNSGEMFSWGGNEKLKNKLLSATFGKVRKIIVQEAKSRYTYNIFVVCILKNGTAKSWMAYEDDEYRKITERIEGIKNLVDFQWAGDYLMILNEQGELTLLEEEWGEEELNEHKYSGVQCACVSEARDPAFVDKSGEIYQGYPTSFPRKGTGNKKNKFNRISHILDYKARCGWVSDVTYLLDEKGNLSSLSSETDDPWYEVPEGLDNVIQFGQWGGIVIALRQTQETLPSKVQRKNNHEDDTTPIPKLNSQHKSLINKRGKKVGNSMLSARDIKNFKISQLTKVIKSYLHTEYCGRFGALDNRGKPYIIAEFPSLNIFDRPELTSPFWLPSGCKKITIGSDYNLLLTDSGEVIAWGDNSNKQCLIPDFTDVSIIDVTAGYVTPGQGTAVVLNNSGDSIAWGGEIDPIDQRTKSKREIKERESSRKRWLKQLNKEKIKTLLSTHEWITESEKRISLNGYGLPDMDKN